MKPLKSMKEGVIHYPHSSMERRHSVRASMAFGLMYSAIGTNGTLMGDGTVVDLSRNGLGIQGNHPVKAGMELSIILYIPDGDDPLFVMEATVAWVSGSRFGVEFKSIHLREANRLRSFLHARSALTMACRSLA